MFLGRKIADIAVKVGLIKIMQKFDVEVEEKTLSAFDARAALAFPKDGINLIFRKAETRVTRVECQDSTDL